MPNTDEEKRYLVFTTYDEIDYQIFHEYGGPMLDSDQNPEVAGEFSVHRTACMKQVLLFTAIDDESRHRLGRLPVPDLFGRTNMPNWFWSASHAVMVPRSEIKKRGLRPCKHCYRWGRTDKPRDERR